MNSALLTIGNELLSGATVNTNASYLGEQLFAAGFPVRESMVVRDDRKSILRALDYLWESHRLIIITGGLGPTHDDVTLTALSEFFDSPLEFHQPTYDALSDRLQSRDITLTERHREQAKLPRDATILPNPVGTAPALYFSGEGKHLFAMPGVPHEMRELLRERLLPEIEALSGDVHVTRVLRTVGIPESDVYSRVKDLVGELPEESVAFLPQAYGVDVRMVVPKEGNGVEMVEAVVEGMRSRLGNAVYTEIDESLAAVVGALLRETGSTLAVAESCTGGLLADEVTNVPGSSDYFRAGYVTYSNRSKMQLLGVPEGLIREYGAVSPQVAEAMVSGVLESSGADMALSTTGIAGPGGGTDEKPVGLVYIGCGVKDTVVSEKFQFTDERRLNKERSVAAALNLLRIQLLGG